MAEDSKRRGRPPVTGVTRTHDNRAKLNDIENDILNELATNARTTRADITRKAIVEYYSNHSELRNRLDEYSEYEFEDDTDDIDDLYH